MKSLLDLKTEEGKIKVKILEICDNPKERGYERTRLYRQKMTELNSIQCKIAQWGKEEGQVYQIM